MLNTPEAVLIFGLVIVGVFRKSVERLIERTVKIKDWLEAPKQAALPAPVDQNLPTRNADDEQRGLEELTKGFDNQLLLLQEESIREDLAKHHLTVETASEKVLVRHLAGNQIALEFEGIFSAIYLSQLRALRWLNAQSEGVEAKALIPFYQQAAHTWPTLYANFNFNTWLSFLAGRGLITESELSKAAPDDAEPFGLQITVMGRAFLAYLVSAGRPDPSLG